MINEILGKINLSDDEQKESILKEALNKYAIEIEHMEDFAIRYYYNENFRYISFHQVKAGDSKSKIDKDAIYSVIENLIEYRNYTDENGVIKDTIGYIHVPDNSIVLSENNLKSIYDEQREKCFDDLNNIISNQDDWESLYESIKNEGKKYSVKRKIHTKLNEKDINKSKENYEAIKNVILEVKKEIEKTSFPDSNVMIQVYPEYFKRITEIEDKIIKTIKSIHSKFKKYEQSMDDDTIKKKILPQLIQRLTEFIDEKKKNPKLNPIIKFKEIYGFIENPTEEVDFNYGAYRFRVNLADSFPRYSRRKCLNEIYDCKDCKDNNQCNLACFLNEFKKLNVTQVGRFLKNTAIARDIYFSEQQIPSVEDIHKTIFKYLREVNKFKLEKESRVTAYKNNKNYWCTCESEIDKDDLEDYKSNIVDVLFEADFLVTREISEELYVSNVLIGFTDEDIQKLEPDIQEKFKDEDIKILNSKKIKAINIEMAKEVLCND